MLVQMIGQITAWTVVKDHVKVVWRLETIVHLDHKWVGCLLQDVAFGDSVLKLLVTVKIGFL